MGFLLEARSNSKVTLIKTKCFAIYNGNNNSDGNHGYCWQRLRYQLPKGVCTAIITEATLFLSGFSFTNIQDTHHIRVMVRLSL